MLLSNIFSDKSLKQKAKVEAISARVLNKKISIAELVSFAEKANDTEKGTCIESMEFATKQQPDIATDKCLKFIIKALSDEAPRVKWEAAKVIGEHRCNISNKIKTSCEGVTRKY